MFDITAVTKLYESKSHSHSLVHVLPFFCDSGKYISVNGCSGQVTLNNGREQRLLETELSEPEIPPLWHILLTSEGAWWYLPGQIIDNI